MSKLIRIGGARVETIHGVGKTVRNRAFEVKDKTQYDSMVVQTTRFVTPAAFAKKFPDEDADAEVVLYSPSPVTIPTLEDKEG